ncbi:putative cystathionine beta-lyase [Microbacterium sp. C448]|uniref:MalY/PatB family protein n=1 Tax=Microbacterium sp. C448 TaxID=1177594 RepID=UPI0003DE3D36|nr:aminotransferase class I/II-fold pyridoxal phosphate-dependent enzyme [Microbacterium sp. C448]CDK00798.1 putative cystathionine beta-lyase [Microbacterium sp. C448]
MTVVPLEALPLYMLRERSSVKWRRYPADVLPMFVAETDFPLAPAITAALSRAVALGDTGYTSPASGIRESYAAFAARRFGWDVAAGAIRSTGDVIMGVVEILRRSIAPGDRVVVTPPVYPPFYEAIPEAGGVVERVPLLRRDGGFELDLAGIETALRDGARAVLLCNPHNPTGTVHSRATLARLAEIAEEFGAVVVSDEIHAPLAQPEVTFTPFLDASDAAARVGYIVTSASKAFNLAGLKCALMIATDPERFEVVRNLPAEVEWRTGLFGSLAGVAAFSPESDEWLDSMLAAVDRNRRLLRELLTEHVPGARYVAPDAGYLAWVDLSDVGWGDNPGVKILRDGKVALHYGPAFGVEGRGHVRLNIGCSPEVLTEAVQRIGALIEK